MNNPERTNRIRELAYAQRLRNHRRQCKEEILFKGIQGMQIEGSVELKETDSKKINHLWSKTIQLDFPSSASIRKGNEDDQIVNWLEECVDLLQIRSEILINLTNAEFFPLLRATVASHKVWVKPFYRVVMNAYRDFSVLLINEEKDRMLVFEDAEDDLLCFFFEWEKP